MKTYISIVVLMLNVACTADASDDAGKSAQAIGSCVSFKLESEASDFFVYDVGEGSMGSVSCGDDPLYYLDQTWNCIEDRDSTRFTVVRYSPDADSWQYIERYVVPSRGDAWRFRCEYDDVTVCGRISCRRI